MEKKRLIGLALSGGAVRGAAHLGVLEVLEREGIRPDFVAGTSAGSVVGAAYCAGLPLEQLETLALDLRWRKVGHLTRPRLGFFDSQGLEDYLAELIQDRTFDELDIPLSTVAVDILSGEVVIMSEGRVATAVRASCAVPGIFTPVEWHDRLLVDGGLLNNLPVSVVQAMGADYVIAVDLLPTSMLPERPKSLLSMWYATVYTAMRATHMEGQGADCIVTPQVGPFLWTDFSKIPILIELGREAAEEKLGQIKRDLGLDAQASATQTETPASPPIPLGAGCNMSARSGENRQPLNGQDSQDNPVNRARQSPRQLRDGRQ